MKFSLLIIIVLCCVLPHNAKAYGDHDIHVSVTEVKWNAESTSFQVSIKIFIDDLERAMTRTNVSGLNIGTPKESADANDLITDYVEKHFHISLDGIQLPAEFIGKETTEDYKAIWCYMEYPGTKDPKKCSISNDLLFELYDDQRSIMDIRMSPDHKAYTIFEPGKSIWSFTF